MKSENSTAQIKCTSYSHFHFNESQFIYITNLELVGCGGNQVKDVESFVIQNTKFIGVESSRTALEMIETSAEFVNSTFVSNRNGSYRKCIQFGDGTYWNVSFHSGYIGGAIIAKNSVVNISQSMFEDNGADYGGAIFVEQRCTIYLSKTIFISNYARNGGVMSSSSSESFDYCNSSDIKSIGSSNITITESEFYSNKAANHGGVLFSRGKDFITIEESKFYNNCALVSGGVLQISSSLTGSPITVTIEVSEFYNNSAARGGVMRTIGNSIITIDCSNFTKNRSPRGAVIYATDGLKIRYIKHVLFDSNSANDYNYGVVYLYNSEFSGDRHARGSVTFSNNIGSLTAFSSNITFTGHATFMNNHRGAIIIFRSNVRFNGVCTFEFNHANNGGAIQATNSKLYVNGNLTIAYNTATRNGGGVYLSNSEFNCQPKSSFELINNTAAYKGGGIHAISSSINKVTSYINWCKQLSSPFCYGENLKFIGNAAEIGGGLSLEANAKVYMLRHRSIKIFDNLDLHEKDGSYSMLRFIANSAHYGGAIYVNDNTNSGTCSSHPKTECFFQVLALYDHHSKRRNIIITQGLYFSQNLANVSGSILYGGLLDRCAVSQFAEVKKTHAPKYRSGKSNGIAYFTIVSTAYYDTDRYRDLLIDNVSSSPVRVCLCIDSKYDNCTHQHYKAQVKKGETFPLSLIAVDQIGHPVNATIQASLTFTDSSLAEGQLFRKISAKCTDLGFNIASPHSLEKLTIYASDGPCKDSAPSSTIVEIHFLSCSCPIGLQIFGKSTTNCTCECHSNISRYMEHCDSHSGSLVKRLQSRAWISYINGTELTGYLVYPNCPLDYCLLTSPPVNLNQPNGADAQCAFNRSSLLCGSCQPGLSLSLGSSRCLSCPSYWPALFTTATIAASLAGIALVTLLLVLNMTVAIGTLNGLIFYANVVHANKNILLPFQETNFITVFVSWLNLELGIDFCCFPGMDYYIKIWLQLAFPAYVIFLVISVIALSSYSTKFSNLIGKKDPVATLATLILLSFAKVLEICFKSLSVGILKYPNGLNEKLWLPDATVKYLSGKHIPLFIVAVLILLVGLVYTALLFSWQWLLHLPRWKIFNWSRNPRIQTFIETYHKPYTPKHRYWTGLLLIARIVLYFVAAVNVSNDPTVALTTISLTLCCIILLKGFIVSRLAIQKMANGCA